MQPAKFGACLFIALGAITSGCSNDDSPPAAANGTPAIADAAGTPAGTLPPASTWVDNAPRKGSCFLDAINGIPPVNAGFQVQPSVEATFDGWSATSDLQGPSAVRLYLIGPGKFEIEGRTGIAREDVAKAYGPGLGSSGFRVDATRMLLPPGEYQVFIGSTSTNLGLEICDTGSKVTVR